MVWITNEKTRGYPPSSHPRSCHHHGRTSSRAFLHRVSKLPHAVKRPGRYLVPSPAGRYSHSQPDLTPTKLILNTQPAHRYVQNHPLISFAALYSSLPSPKLLLTTPLTHLRQRRRLSPPSDSPFHSCHKTALPKSVLISPPI